MEPGVKDKRLLGSQSGKGRSECPTFNGFETVGEIDQESVYLRHDRGMGA